LTDAKRLIEVGMINQADLLSAESQLAESELLLERASNLATLNEHRLRTAMHDESGLGYEIGENVDAEASKLGTTLDQRTLHTQALERRLELKAMDASSLALQEQAKLARAAQLPRLDGMADATYANPNQRVVPSRDEFTGSWTAGVALTWTPSDIPAAGAQARSSEAKASAVDADKRALADSIGVEIARALQSEREAEKAIETNERRLRSAEEAYRVRNVLFQNGRATGVELTDAETELTRARLDVISSRVGLRVARVELEHAAGGDVEL
jgi:outer membrane protein TolC